MGYPLAAAGVIGVAVMCRGVIEMIACISG